MKQIFLAIILSISFVSLACARLVSIADWNPTLTSRTNDKPEKEEVVVIGCAEKCPGYSISVTICPVYGETQKACPVSGCEHYYRCVKNY